jgi:hypothetical protein
MADNPATVLDELSAQIAELRRQLQGHVGSDYASPMQDASHPGSLIMYQHVHGPSRSSVDATHAATFYMEFDSDVKQLYKSKVSFRLSKVRSNVSASSLAAAGSQTPTSSSGGSQTPTSSSAGSQTPTSGNGGAQTSSSGGSQTPTSSNNDSAGSSSTAQVLGVNAGSANTGAGSSHSHGTHDHASVSATFDGDSVTDTASVPAEASHTHAQNYGTVDALTSFSITHAHTVSVAAHTHTVADHTHSVTIAAHNHTVTVAAHTHTVTIADHNHSVTMTYGIYEGPAPSTPGITITINGTDVTTALGGPWNAGATVDVTSYLREHTLQPLYQANTIVFGSSELLDIEFEARSLCATASPLGLAL